MTQTGRVVLHTSRVRAVLLLLIGATFLAVGVVGLVVTLDGAGNLILGVVWFGFITLFGLAGVVVSVLRMLRPEALVVEPHRLMWGPNVIPWAWVSAVERHSVRPGHPGFLLVRFTDAAAAAIPTPDGAVARGLDSAGRSMFQGRTSALPQNLNGRIKDQLAFLQQVHAWSQGSGRQW